MIVDTDGVTGKLQRIAEKKKKRKIKEIKERLETVKACVLSCILASI